MKFIEEVQQFYKLYSVWGIAFLGILPDLYNVCLGMGVFEGTDVPELYARFTNIIAVITIFVRLIKQEKLRLDSLPKKEVE